jgi:hypothetical protein
MFLWAFTRIHLGGTNITGLGSHTLVNYQSRFFWQWDSEKKKYRLVKCSVVCRPKDQGGLGVHDLAVKNPTLLGKWLFNLLTEDGVWQTLLKRKYIGAKALSQVIWKPGDKGIANRARYLCTPEAR